LALGEKASKAFCAVLLALSPRLKYVGGGSGFLGGPFTGFALIPASLSFIAALMYPESTVREGRSLTEVIRPRWPADASALACRPGIREPFQKPNAQCSLKAAMPHIIAPLYSN